MVTSLILLLAATADAKLPADWSRRARPAAIWLGQDGVDRAGAEPGGGPNEVQDIHIALAGLPADRAIESGTIRPYGGGLWTVGGPGGPAVAAVVRRDGASTADLYVEPYMVETGRDVSLELKLAGGATFAVNFKGGRADPSRRMPAHAMKARWLGQPGPDRVGPGPAVGPDGHQDAVIELSNISTRVEIASVVVDDGKGHLWRSHANPEGSASAEVVRRPGVPGCSDVHIAADGIAGGSTLRVAVRYADGKGDSATIVAGRVVPSMAVPVPPMPKVEDLNIKATWHGQDGSGASPGLVHVSIEGIPANREVLAAALADLARGHWSYRAGETAALPVDPESQPLDLRRAPGLTRVDLYFAPRREVADGELTLALAYRGGGFGVARFPAGAASLAALHPQVEPHQATARPGDDLHALVARGGTVRLGAGTYRLDRPLVLDRPTRLLGPREAVLRFDQPAGVEPWTAALKVRASNTRLEGFSVRFGGPVRWREGTSYGPAVVGTSDNFDPGPSPLLDGLAFEGLDLESPPPSTGWEEAPPLIRLATARSGRVVGCRLRGGVVEFLRGLWVVEKNRHIGTHPKTFAWGAFAGHGSRDLVFRGNSARPVGPSGKTWRLLVLTVEGYGDRVVGNEASGIGPVDGEAYPNMNAPEIILTESYQVGVEGRPLATSADGRLLRMPPPQGPPPTSGNAASVVGGPMAGTWRRVSMVLEPDLLLLDGPMPTGAPAVTVSAGFMGEVFEGNTVDARGSRTAVGLYLTGNHYGAKVLDNRIYGGSGLRITSPPTESPVHWGWSHAPSFGGLVRGNLVEDAAGGLCLAVEHGGPIKSSRDRVYLEAEVKGNTVRWTEGFVASWPRDKPRPPGIALGEPGSLGGVEMLVKVSGNRAEGPAGAVPGSSSRGATVNEASPSSTARR